MNEQDEEILLTVTLDEGQTQERCKAINAQLKFLRDTAKGLDKDLKDGTVSQRQYDEAIGRITDQSKKLSVELSTQKKALDDSRKGIVANSGSLNEMQAKASAAKAEFLALTKAERENKDIGGELLKRVHELNEAHDEGQRQLNTSRKGVSDYVKDISVLGIRVGDVTEAFKGGAQGLTSFAKTALTGQNALKLLAATPVLILFTALVAFLKSTDEGMDRVERATAALSAGFSALMKGIAPLGKLLVDTFTHPYDTLQKLIGGTDEYNVSVIGVAKSVRDAALAADAYTAAIQNIDDAQNALIAKQALVSEQVELALKQTRDRSLSEAERLRILKEAGQAEGKLADEAVENERKRTVATQLRILQTVEGSRKGQELLKKMSTQDLLDYVATSGKYTDAQVEEFNKSIAAFVDVRKARLQTEQTIQNRTSALIEQEAAKRKSAQEKQLTDEKAAAQERVRHSEVAVLQAKKTGEDTLALEQLVIKRRAESELIGIKGTQERLLILAKAEADGLELRVKYAQEANARTLGVNQAGIEARLALAKKGTQEELDLRQDLLKLQADQAKNALPADKQNASLRATQVKAIDAKLKADLRANGTAFLKDQLNQQQELASQRLETEENLAEDTLANQRKFAKERIDLEEKQALELLKLTEQTEERRLVKTNLIQSKAVKARKDLDKAVVADRVDDARNELEAQLALVREGSKEELRLKKKGIADKLAADIAAAKNNDAVIKRLKALARQEEEKLDEDYSKKAGEKVIAVATAATTALGSIFQAQAQLVFKALDEQQEAALKSAGANADLRERIEAEYQKKKLKLEKEAAQKQQKISSIQNIISTAVAVTKAFEAGPFAGAILAALAIANGLAQQSIIDSQQFAKGGTYISDGKGAYIQGAGTGTSDSINSKLSNGESVLTAKATDMFYSQLSAMNVAGGGNPFPYASIAPAPQLNNFSMGGVHAPIDTNAIAAAIVDGLKGANIAVAVTDIHSVESDMVYARANGNL